ncbi:single-stranded DNA-binding protein [Burkholderia pseudomallei]|uniref:single-stranded DNA-binding protein n=1 Tax=Burkholderia pseudomallei TaxID=28450 RepID=UPI000F06A471|nr:single-stranded DNA-binding protein [Burkholderia pseudomallei]MDV2185946.1 single-stranded DNA-binding protein [Burkholderia pseudomallei]CAJ3220086.1 Single-strand binding protein family [Burkholderia pseudomallei]CAJ3307470.1 Single-strand binding protein family [Burkholderia pseudomallei]CAJ3916735.1 Single-strand binding protein family [Burkholderia pseudomallei]CAJ5033348.1 Single-strand binding protein family [Burkholderia pseudomallei]
MLDALASGKLYGKPGERTGPSGRPFVTAKVRVPAGDGEALFVNVIAFSDGAKAALLALDDGDSVALAGTLTPKVWTDRNGDAKPALDMVAHAVLTAYHVKHKRVAMQGSTDGDERRSGRPAMDGCRQAAAFYNGDTSDMQDDL